MSRAEAHAVTGDVELDLAGLKENAVASPAKAKAKVKGPVRAKGDKKEKAASKKEKATKAKGKKPAKEESDGDEGEEDDFVEEIEEAGGQKRTALKARQ